MGTQVSSAVCQCFFQVLRNKYDDDALVVAALSPGQLQLTCTQAFGVYFFTIIYTTSQWFIIPSHVQVGVPPQEE